MFRTCKELRNAIHLAHSRTYPDLKVLLNGNKLSR